MDIGGGTTDIAVISLGGIVVSHPSRWREMILMEAIIRHVRKAHNLFIGEQTAEAVKIKIGTACKRSQIETMEVKGRNVITGLPKTVTLTSEEVKRLCRRVQRRLWKLFMVFWKRLRRNWQQILWKGDCTYRWRFSFRWFEEIITEHTGINTMTAENPACAVAEGTGMYVEMMAKLGK